MLPPFCHMAFCVLSLGTLASGANLADPFTQSGPTLGSQDRSVTLRLEDLGHGEARARQFAHGWLVRQLSADDWLAVVEAAAAGNYAARRGLAQVLADHPRHFALAARLTGQPDSMVAEVGEWALQESALAWSPGLMERPLQLPDFPETWLLEGGRDDSLMGNPRVPKPGGLVVALDRLHLYGDAPANLILDPRLDPRRRRVSPVALGGEPLSGSWETLLIQLVKEHKVTLEIVGWRPESIDASGLDGVDLPGAFIRVCARGETDQGRGSQLLARWVRGAVQETYPQRRVACANALAQVGWPAAVAWLSQGWLGGEETYLEAVCIAAARGHLSPALLGPQGVLRLLQQGGSALQGGGGRAWDRTWLAARALRAIPAVLSDGSALGDVLLQNWPAKNERGLWLRYSAFSGRFRVHSELAQRAKKTVQGSGSPALRRAALAAFVSAGGTEVGLVKDLPSMMSGLKPIGIEAWLRDLELAGARPGDAAEYQALEALDVWAGRFAFWWFVVGAENQALEVARRVVKAQGGLASFTASLAQPLARGRRKEVAVWVDGLREILPESGQRLALRLSLLDGAGAFAQLESILALADRSAEELMDLAYLAPMETVGARARGALIGALEANPSPPGLGDALEQAQFNLRSSGAFLLTEMFEADLRRKALRASHPLSDRILGDSWAQQSLQGTPFGIRAPLGEFEELPPR
ncbi:MAG: hypothetical protein ACI87O_000345 [Planctomycetota bacterium]|jgi:hypothetical protein